MQTHGQKSVETSHNFKTSFKKVNRKVQEEPQAKAAANLPTRGVREKMTQINVCIANKQMHDQQKDQLPLPQEQGNTKNVAPRSVNYRATQNKNNIGTTALERSVVYTTGGGGWGGFKGLSLYKLHPGSRCNSEYKNT